MKMSVERLALDACGVETRTQLSDPLFESRDKPRDGIFNLRCRPNPHHGLCRNPMQAQILIRIATMLREDLENKTTIGLLFEESVKKIFDEELVSQTDLEKDQDKSEAKTDEDRVNGFVEAV